jgi:hypothetical protein
MARRIDKAIGISQFFGRKNQDFRELSKIKKKIALQNKPS